MTIGLHWLTTIVLVFAVTASAVEHNLLLGLPFFIIAIVNEAIASYARASSVVDDEEAGL